MADPTRPAGSKPVALPETAPRRSAANGLREQATTAETKALTRADIGDAAEVDANIDATRELLDVGRAEVVRVDADRLAALKRMVADGTYRVDAGNLADRILDDAAL